MPGVPKASPEATLSKPPFEPPLSDLASESDTCPEYPYIGPSRKLPSAPRVQRVILPPKASECDTCHEYTSRENPSGCRTSWTTIPDCLNHKPHPGALRASHVSRGPSHREFPLEITRVRRVSRD